MPVRFSNTSGSLVSLIAGVLIVFLPLPLYRGRIALRNVAGTETSRGDREIQQQRRHHRAWQVPGRGCCGLR